MIKRLHVSSIWSEDLNNLLPLRPGLAAGSRDAGLRRPGRSGGPRGGARHLLQLLQFQR